MIAPRIETTINPIRIVSFYHLFLSNKLITGKLITDHCFMRDNAAHSTFLVGHWMLNW